MKQDYEEAREDFRASCKLINKIDEEQRNKGELLNRANEKIYQLEEELEKEKLTQQVKICKEREKYEEIIAVLHEEKTKMEMFFEEFKKKKDKVLSANFKEKTDTPSLSPKLNRDIQRLAEKSNDRVHFDCISYSHLDLKEKIKELSKSREDQVSDDDDEDDDDDTGSPYFDDEANSWNIRTCEVNMNKNKDFQLEKSEKTLFRMKGGDRGRGLKRDFSTMGFTVDDQTTVKILGKNASFSNVTLAQNKSSRRFDEYVRTPSGKKYLGNGGKSEFKKKLMSFGKMRVNEKKLYDSDNKENLGLKRKALEFNLHTEESENQHKQRKSALEMVKLLRSCQKPISKFGEEVDNRFDVYNAGNDCCGDRSLKFKCCLV